MIVQNASDINQLTAHLFRENAGKMVAVLSNLFGLKDIDWILDVVHDSFEAALTKWRFSGVPDNPSAWLMQVAKNKALNEIKKTKQARKYASQQTHEENGLEPTSPFDEQLLTQDVHDSQLRLLFACCHPALSQQNQVVVTLHILCGFGVPEIAHALLMNAETVKKALTRSKAVLRKQSILCELQLVLNDEVQSETVLTILYLLFNEGYKTTRGREGINYDLCYEAMRLTKLLVEKKGMQNHGAEALLALMFFTIARFPARLNNGEDWLTLEEQDRSLWNQQFIAEGYSWLKQATHDSKLAKYHLHAIISSLHCSARSFADTDWEKITWLYQQLEILDTSPVVKLNRIIAESYIHNNYRSAIHALDELTEFRDLFLLHTSKAHIHHRAANYTQAIKHYELALVHAVSPIDKKFLEKKMNSLRGEANNE